MTPLMNRNFKRRV